jgi:hypothetical protein
MQPDIGLSAIQFGKEGSDDAGWVVRMIVPSESASGTKNQVVFVLRERGTYKVLGGGGDYTGAARLVNRLASEGKLEQANLWLDRVRQELAAGNSDDPLSGSMFARIWRQGQTPESKRIVLAAAMLLSSTGPPKPARRFFSE